ncbi:NAD-dependent epimerase/dehydratase family protein [Gammaproteobacteria bacterium]|nr:NAD-dependent epimerase/dehydratase family protein [Gammaproteobacteria bacterium]
MKVLITGSNGFVGKELSDFFKSNGIDHKCLTRNSHYLDSDQKYVLLDNFYCVESWVEVLKDIDVVIHLVAKTHNNFDDTKNSLKEYRNINVKITEALCKAIKKSVVRRLVFLSSIKVNGESTNPNQFFDENTIPKPEDNYGKTKLEAEEVIKREFSNSEKEYAIIRAPLLYSPENLKGNLELLEKIIRKGIPLPLGAIKNQRSILELKTLCEFISACLSSIETNNKIFLVSNDEKFSTPEIIYKIGNDIFIAPKIFPFPQKLLELFFLIIGKKELSKKLLSNLEIDNKSASDIMSLSLERK